MNPDSSLTAISRARGGHAIDVRDLVLLTGAQSLQPAVPDPVPDGHQLLGGHSQRVGQCLRMLRGGPAVSHFDVAEGGRADPGLPGQLSQGQSAEDAQLGESDLCVGHGREVADTDAQRLGQLIRVARVGRGGAGFPFVDGVLADAGEVAHVSGGQTAGHAHPVETGGIEPRHARQCHSPSLPSVVVTTSRYRRAFSRSRHARPLTDCYPRGQYAGTI